MAAPGTEQRAFFRQVSDGATEFSAERFLTEVDSQFQSKEIRHEVRWRLDVLREIASRPELVEVTDGLRNKLTQIFSGGADEEEILEELKGLTEIKGSDGAPVDLRRFVTRAKRRLTEVEYRQILTRKIENTEFQVRNLVAFFPEAQPDLASLGKGLAILIRQTRDLAIPTTAIRADEDRLRLTPTFQVYETLKNRYLRDWLSKFTSLSEEEIAKLSPDEVQRMIMEHQRHHMTQLVKAKISLSDLDMTDHLGMHDTLESTFKNEEFWRGANAAARRGFTQWILGAVQVFGLPKGRRYAFFQALEHKDIYLLFGMGMADFPASLDTPIEMRPYMKPFTRKAGYLLEIRARELRNPEEYKQELRHYVLPFLFAFDGMKNFKLIPELVSFFAGKY